MSGLEVDVVIVGLWPELDLLQFRRVRISLRLALVPRLLILPLARIDDLADRRLCRWRNLEQIEAGLLRFLQRFRDGENPELLTIFGDDAHGRDANALVDTRAGWTRSSTK